MAKGPHLVAITMSSEIKSRRSLIRPNTYRVEGNMGEAGSARCGPHQSIMTLFRHLGAGIVLLFLHEHVDDFDAPISRVQVAQRNSLLR